MTLSLFYASLNVYTFLLTRYYHTKLNGKCQELDLMYLTVSFVATWRIFTPPGEFYLTRRILHPILEMSEA